MFYCKQEFYKKDCGKIHFRWIMVVYIEYVLIDNFVIDFIILYSLGKILKLHINYVRLVLASLLGVIFAFLTPYLSVYNILLLLLKFAMAIVLVFVAFKFKKTKNFVIAWLCFLFLTFLLGGVCYGLQGLLQSAKILGGAFAYENSFPVSLIILAVFVFIILGSNLFNYIKTNKTHANISIVFNGQTKNFVALVDSGNQLIDEKTKMAISFLNRKDFLNYFGVVDFKNILTYENILCKTVAGSKLLDTITVDKIIVDKKITILNARIALYNFDSTQDFNAIISSNLLV